LRTPYFTAFPVLFPMCDNQLKAQVIVMNEVSQGFSPDPSADSRKWIGRIALALILAEAIWAFLVALTNDLIVPALARVIGGDAQSPLYLGTGDYNVPGLFAAVLELCFAGIVAILLNSWSQRKPKVRSAPVRRTVAPAAQVAAPPVAPQAPRVTAPVPPAPPVAAAIPPPPPKPAPVQAVATPQAAPPPKPKQPKEVYYNSVGEPMEPED
jgi:hypothetical protein